MSQSLAPFDDFLSRYLEHGRKKQKWSQYHLLDSRVSLRRLQAWMKHEGLQYSDLNWQKLQGLHRFLALQGVSTKRCLRAINHAQRALRWGVEQGELSQKLTDLYVFHFSRNKWNSELPPIAEEYLSRLEATLAEKSVKLHRYCLRVFHTYLTEKNLSYRKLRPEHLADYIKYVYAKGFKQRGRNQMVYRVRIFLRWLNERGKVSRSVDQLLPSRMVPKPPKGIPRPLPPELDQRLQALLKETDDIAYKSILLLRYTGMRVGELRILPFECIEGPHPDQMMLRVPPFKLSPERLVPLDAQTVALVIDIQNRSVANSNGEKPKFLVIFPNGTRPGYDLLRAPMTEICARLDTTQWINMHSLRHTYATNLLNAGISLFALKEILGHRTIIMTLNYAKLLQVTVREEYHGALGQMTQTLVPKSLLESLPSSNETTVIEEAFQRLQSLMRRQMDEDNVRSGSEPHKKQLTALSNRMSKVKNEFLRLVQNKG